VFLISTKSGIPLITRTFINYNLFFLFENSKNDKSRLDITDGFEGVLPNFPWSSITIPQRI